MFTYHRSCRDGIPFEPECDKWRRYENDTRDEESREIERSITGEDEVHLEAAVVACKIQFFERQATRWRQSDVWSESSAPALVLWLSYKRLSVYNVFLSASYTEFSCTQCQSISFLHFCVQKFSFFMRQSVCVDERFSASRFSQTALLTSIWDITRGKAHNCFFSHDVLTQTDVPYSASNW